MTERTRRRTWSTAKMAWRMTWKRSMTLVALGVTTEKTAL
jgi:hypothetical protein